MRSMRSRSAARAAWSMLTRSLALARSFEGRRNGLHHGRELAGGERHERHAWAIRVARATRAIAVAVESGAVGTLEAVVLADDPFLHSAGSSLEPGWPASARSRPALCVSPLACRARIPYGAYRREPRLRRGFSPNFPHLSVYFRDSRPAHGPCSLRGYGLGWTPKTGSIALLRGVLSVFRRSS